jgi:hypothetical protein
MFFPIQPQDGPNFEPSGHTFVDVFLEMLHAFRGDATRQVSLLYGLNYLFF